MYLSVYINIACYLFACFMLTWIWIKIHTQLSCSNSFFVRKYSFWRSLRDQNFLNKTCYATFCVFSTRICKLSRFWYSNSVFCKKCIYFFNCSLFLRKSRKAFSLFLTGKCLWYEYHETCECLPWHFNRKHVKTQYRYFQKKRLLCKNLLRHLNLIYAFCFYYKFSRLFTTISVTV